MINLVCEIILTAGVAIGLLFTTMVLFIGALGLIDVFFRTHLLRRVENLLFYYEEVEE